MMFKKKPPKINTDIQPGDKVYAQFGYSFDAWTAVAVFDGGRAFLLQHEKYADLIRRFKADEVIKAGAAA
jgi:hypothetical protein